MELNDLLTKSGIDPSDVLVLRHRPPERKLYKVLPWIVSERPELFNAYQQTQGEKLEQAMLRARYVASFLGRETGKAHFVALYAIGEARPITDRQYWEMSACQELKAFGMDAGSAGRDTQLWFDLHRQDFYADWSGKLVVGWPPPERSWWRRAHRNSMPVLAIHEESQFGEQVRPWDEIDLGWSELKLLPIRWRTTLSHWRGVYFIFDTRDGRGYVGSAYGSENLLGRWLNYAASGHGGNAALRRRDPSTFRFTILQLLSPGMEAEEVIRVESSWKERLHTRAPHGLNEN